MVNRLDHYRRDIRDDHSLLTGFILESCKATERRVHQGPDLFAGVQMPAVPEEKGMTMRIKFKVSRSIGWLLRERISDVDVGSATPESEARPARGPL